MHSPDILAASTQLLGSATVFISGLVLMGLFFWYFATEIERRKRNVGTMLVIGLCALCGLALYPLNEQLKGGIGGPSGGEKFGLNW